MAVVETGNSQSSSLQEGSIPTDGGLLELVRSDFTVMPAPSVKAVFHHKEGQTTCIEISHQVDSPLPPPSPDEVDKPFLSPVHSTEDTRLTITHRTAHMIDPGDGSEATNAIRNAVDTYHGDQQQLLDNIRLIAAKYDLRLTHYDPVRQVSYPDTLVTAMAETTRLEVQRYATNQRPKDGLTGLTQGKILFQPHGAEAVRQHVSEGRAVVLGLGDGCGVGPADSLGLGPEINEMFKEVAEKIFHFRLAGDEYVLTISEDDDLQERIEALNKITAARFQELRHKENPTEREIEIIDLVDRGQNIVDARASLRALRAEYNQIATGVSTKDRPHTFSLAEYTEFVQNRVRELYVTMPSEDRPEILRSPAEKVALPDLFELYLNRYQELHRINPKEYPHEYPVQGPPVLSFDIAAVVLADSQGTPLDLTPEVFAQGFAHLKKILSDAKQGTMQEGAIPYLDPDIELREAEKLALSRSEVHEAKVAKALAVLRDEDTGPDAAFAAHYNLEQMLVADPGVPGVIRIGGLIDKKVSDILPIDHPVEVTVCKFDLVDFGPINNSLGYERADQVYDSVRAIVESELETSTFVRFGGGGLAAIRIGDIPLGYRPPPPLEDSSIEGQPQNAASIEERLQQAIKNRDTELVEALLEERLKNRPDPNQGRSVVRYIDELMDRLSIAMSIMAKNDERVCAECDERAALRRIFDSREIYKGIEDRTIVRFDGDRDFTIAREGINLSVTRVIVSPNDPCSKLFPELIK